MPPKVYPPRNLPTEAINWGREVEFEQNDARRRLEAIELTLRNNNKGNSSTMGLLASQVATIQNQVNLLTAIAYVQYAEFTTGMTGFAGFAVSPVSVGIKSSTGRIEIGYGGSLNGGTGYFVYQIVGETSGVVVSRIAVQANPAQRVAVSGGAAFAPSGFKNVIVEVPKDELLTVSLEIYATDAFTYFFGGSIQARVAP